MALQNCTISYRTGLGIRLARWAVLLVMAGLIGVLFAAQGQAQNVRPPSSAVNQEATDAPGPPNTLGSKSDSDFWRDYRGGDPADLFRDTPEGQVMTTTGQHWREFRVNYLAKYAWWLPLIVLVLLVLHFVLKGTMRISEGRSGKMMPRFSVSARMVHWFMAVIFITLGITGLIILLARPIFVPLLGSYVTSFLARAGLMIHNYIGPLFILALVLMFIKFVRGNFFQLVDIRWMLKAGGMFGGHVSSSRFNFGEKSWFWMVVLLGGVMGATGLALEFPFLVEDLRLLQGATIIHAIGAIILVSVALGHIYMGTIAMEGSLESMTKGEVDENWAKEHHDIWYAEMKAKEAEQPKENT